MPRSKEQHDRETQAKFLKTFYDGTWQDFLHIDANTTRKGFAGWYSETYLKSAEGRSISKAAKAEVHNLLNCKAPINIDRDTLHPETQVILRTWEEIPLAVGSPEYSRAITRWVKDIAVAGLLHEMLQSVIGEHLSSKDIAEARSWIYIGPDGRIQGYQPLAQPWYPKSLQWDNEISSFATVTCIPNENDPPNPTMSLEMPADQESLRITTATFEQLVQGTDRPVAMNRSKDEGNRPIDTMDSGSSQGGSSISGRNQSPVDNAVLPARGAEHAVEDVLSRRVHQPLLTQPGTIHAQPNAAVASSPSYSPPLEWEDEPGPSDERVSPGGVPIDPEAQAEFIRVWRPTPKPLFTSDDQCGERDSDLGGAIDAIEVDMDSEMKTELEEGAEMEERGKAVVSGDEWD
ncbi:MAG: hypothetical protein Q9208_001205 [Pyrenodesmia sp. 3 TL-2023]